MKKQMYAKNTFVSSLPANLSLLGDTDMIIKPILKIAPHSSRAKLTAKMDLHSVLVWFGIINVVARPMMLSITNP